MTHETYELRKYGIDKIALFGLLVLAVLAAWLLIISKSAITLSEPIKLICDDLSVSMPCSGGWQCENQWRYQENTFTISSIFVSGGGSITALANCRYLLAPPDAAPQVQFGQKALAMDGVIEKTGQIKTGSLVIDWVLIKKRTMPLGMFFGTASLPNGRRFNIEMFHAIGGLRQALQVFEQIADSLDFKDNRLLEAGRKTIAEIKDKQIGRFLAGQSSARPGLSKSESFFIIRDAKGNTVGFTMDILTDRRETPLSIAGAGFFYFRKPYMQERTVSFRSDDRFEEFVCRMDFSSIFSRKTAELYLDKPAVMTVKRLGPQAEEKIYHIGPAAVPEFFIDQLSNQMFDGSYRKIIIDIIEADGRIVPALVSMADVRTVGEDVENAAYILNMELLDGRGFSQKIYLDSQKQVWKILLQQKDLYILERSDIENILREFPERADYVLRLMKL